MIDFEAVNCADSRRVDTLDIPSDTAYVREIEMRLTRRKTLIIPELQRVSFIDCLGMDNIYGNIYEAGADQIHGGTTCLLE